MPQPDALVQELAEREMLPAIYFVFSRVGCAAAVEQCLAAGLRLTSSEEREQIASLLDPMAEAVECWIESGIEKAMSRFNKVRGEK